MPEPGLLSDSVDAALGEEWWDLVLPVHMLVTIDLRQMAKHFQD